MYDGQLGERSPGTECFSLLTEMKDVLGNQFFYMGNFRKRKDYTAACLRETEVFKILNKKGGEDIRRIDIGSIIREIYFSKGMEMDPTERSADMIFTDMKGGEETKRALVNLTYNDSGVSVDVFEQDFERF